MHSPSRVSASGTTSSSPQGNPERSSVIELETRDILCVLLLLHSPLRMHTLQVLWFRKITPRSFCCCRNNCFLRRRMGFHLFRNSENRGCQKYYRTSYFGSTRNVGFLNCLQKRATRQKSKKKQTLTTMNAQVRI